MTIDLREFTAYLDDAGFHPTTTRVYAWRVEVLGAWLAERGADLATVGTELLEEFLADRTTRTWRSQLRGGLKQYWQMIERKDPPTLAITIPKKEPAPTRWMMIDYKDFLISNGLGPRTVKVYARNLAAFSSWCRSRGIDPVTPTGGDVSLYANEAVPFTNPSRRQLRQALQHFWSWQEVEGPGRAIRVPSKPQAKPKALDLQEARKLVEISVGRAPEGLAVLIGLFLGLRVAEIASARWDRFDTDLSWYRVFGKGGKVADLPVHPFLRAQLLPTRTAYVFLFPSDRGKVHVIPATIWNWVRLLGEEAGIGRIHTHQLRHTALTVINDATGDLRATQEFARHSDIQSTVIYTRVRSDRLQKVAGALDALVPTTAGYTRTTGEQLRRVSDAIKSADAPQLT